MKNIESDREKICRNEEKGALKLKKKKKNVDEEKKLMSILCDYFQVC